MQANPGLPRDGIAVTCDSRRLSEVRICLNKNFSFRGCPEIDRRACRRDKLLMPPVRGGRRAAATPETAPMNYRHAFHAGNFADVVKHAVLARILVHLRAKPAAFRVIDTHAGAGALRSHRRRGDAQPRMA